MVPNRFNILFPQTNKIFQSHTKTLTLQNQYKLQYVEITPQQVSEENPTQYKDLLLIHGLNMNSSLWYLFAQEIMQQAHHAATPFVLRCWIPELPLGAHQQPLPEHVNNSIPLSVSMMKDLIDSLQLKNVVLMGNDTGGALCQIFSSQHSDNVSNLVLTNCDSYSDFFPFPVNLFHYAAFIPGFSYMFSKALTTEAFKKGFYGSVCKKVQNGELDEWVKEITAPLIENEFVKRDFRNIVKDVSSRYTLEAAKSFCKFTKPVLVAWTEEKDPFFKNERGMQLAKDFPNSTLKWIPNSKTFIPIDNPKELAKEVLTFLSESKHQ